MIRRGCLSSVAPPRGERGLKCSYRAFGHDGRRVAPPRGERGLKLPYIYMPKTSANGRSPSWGAWIEMRIFAARYSGSLSLPLVGSVD